MMKNEKITLIIIENNNIEKCIENIRKQSYINDIEIIVLYNENKEEQIENIRPKYEKIQFLSYKQNMFKAIKQNENLIKGKYVSILNSEDDITIDFYRTMAFKAVKNNADMVISNAILKYKDVFIDKFDINEVRKLRPNHMSRAIGRIIGRNGKIKETIEHFSKCKFLLINQRIVLLGCIENIKVARDAICRLIQGSEPNSIFNILKIKSNKLKEKYGELQIIYEDLKKC